MFLREVGESPTIAFGAPETGLSIMLTSVGFTGLRRRRKWCAVTSGFVGAVRSSSVALFLGIVPAEFGRR